MLVAYSRPRTVEYGESTEGAQVSGCGSPSKFGEERYRSNSQPGWPGLEAQRDQESGCMAAREPEYKLEYGPISDSVVVNHTKKIVSTSDGSLRKGKAAVAMRQVQNGGAHCTARLKGRQAIAKAELIGAWLQLKAADFLF